MYDSVRFKEKCKEFVRGKREFLGKEVHSQQEVYEIIADKLCVQPSTVAKWTLPSYGGPDKRKLKELEELIGESLWKIPVEDRPKKYSDFAKQAILDIYAIVTEYFSSPDVEDEELYAEMMSKIEKRRLAIPKKDYDAIEEYLRMNVGDIVYNQETVFGELHSKEYGAYDESGVFVIKEGKEAAFLGRNFEIIFEKENEFQNFMMERFSELFEE